MFGRRGKRAQKTSESTDTEGLGVESVVAAESSAVSVAESVLTEEAPTPGPERSHDSGLEAIEAELTINDNDLRLLDVVSLSLDDMPSPLTAAESAMAEHRALLDDFIVQLNTAWTARLGAPTSLSPYFLVPERCWEGQHCDALVEILGLAPAQPWNVIPLPCDSATATALDLPIHPGTDSLDIVQLAMPMIDDAIGKMQARFEQASFSGDTVDTAALDAARVDASKEIQALAAKLGAGALGEAAVRTARTTFFGDAPAEQPTT